MAGARFIHQGDDTLTDTPITVDIVAVARLRLLVERSHNALENFHAWSAMFDNGDIDIDDLLWQAVEVLGIVSECHLAAGTVEGAAGSWCTKMAYEMAGHVTYMLMAKDQLRKLQAAA